MGNMSLLVYFDKGGPVMWALLVCSVIALAIIIERSFSLRRNKIIPKTLIEEVERLARLGRIADIERIIRRRSSPICPVIMVAIKNAGMRREIIKDYMEEAGATEANIIERNIDVLGIIAVISPLLGFLGTVSGMLKSFHSISAAGVNSSQLLAEGISEALITTVAGLCIGIPVFVCYRLLLARSDFLIFEMEKTSARILEYLKGEDNAVQKETKEQEHHIV